MSNPLNHHVKEDEMHRKSHLATALAAVITSTALLAGCSGTPSGSSTLDESATAGESPTDEAASLRMQIWDENQKPAMDAIAEAFTEQHPTIDVTVELLPFDQYWTKLETGMSGGTAPDVFWAALPFYFTKLARLEMIENLQPLIDRDGVDLSGIDQSLLEAYMFEGSQYAIPKDVDTVGLWYNKALFDAAGVAYPDDTWTWETLRTVAKQLTDAEAGVWGFATDPSDRVSWYNFIPQNGGTIITEDGKSGYDSQEAIDALQFIVDLTLVDKVSPGVAQLEQTTAATLFKGGKLAMMYDGSWRASDFAADPYASENADVAVLPQGVERASSSGMLGYAIWSGTPHKEAAWTFMKFLASREAASIQASFKAGIPSYIDLADGWKASMPQFHLDAFTDMIAYGVVVPHSENTPEWKAMAITEFKKAWLGEVSVEQAATTVAEQMNAILAKERE